MVASLAQTVTEKDDAFALHAILVAARDPGGHAFPNATAAFLMKTICANAFAFVDNHGHRCFHFPDKIFGSNILLLYCFLALFACYCDILLPECISQNKIILCVHSHFCVP